MSSTDMRSLISLMEAAGLEGNINIRTIAKLLPEIDDVERFVSGFNKLKKGQEDRLTRLELTQFALAFMSLLKGDRDDRMMLVRKLGQLRASDDDEIT